MKRGKFMICKNCSANIDDNVAFCPYCGAHNDAQGSQQNAQGYQQSQNEYYNQNEQQSGQYFYNGQQNTKYKQGQITSQKSYQKQLYKYNIKKRFLD